MNRQTLLHMEAMANLHGATLKRAATLRPMSIESSARQGDFSRGVLATLAEFHALASQSPDGRQALLDLGFEPVLEHVEDGGESGRSPSIQERNPI